MRWNSVLPCASVSDDAGAGVGGGDDGSIRKVVSPITMTSLGPQPPFAPVLDGLAVDRGAELAAQILDPDRTVSLGEHGVLRDT